MIWQCQSREMWMWKCQRGNIKMTTCGCRNVDTEKLDAEILIVMETLDWKATDVVNVNCRYGTVTVQKY